MLTKKQKQKLKNQGVKIFTSKDFKVGNKTQKFNIQCFTLILTGFEWMIAKLT